MIAPGSHGAAGADLLARVENALAEPPGTGPPLGRFNELLIRVFEALAEDTTASSSFLTQIRTVDPGKAARLRTQFVVSLIDIFDAHSSTDRFACQALVAAITTLTRQALVDEGACAPGALAALRRPLVHFAERTLC